MNKKTNEAYERLVKSGDLTIAQARVCNVMYHCRLMYQDGMTAREINIWLKNDGRGHSGVHSRLRELEEILMICKDGTKTCTVTRRKVNRWVLR